MAFKDYDRSDLLDERSLEGYDPTGYHCVAQVIGLAPAPCRTPAHHRSKHILGYWDGFAVCDGHFAGLPGRKIPAPIIRIKQIAGKALVTA